MLVDKCINHPFQEVYGVCTHPMCYNFSELCEYCYKKHAEYHDKNEMNGELQPQKPLKDIQQIKLEVKTRICQAKDELQNLQNKIFQEMNIEEDEDSKIEQTISDLFQIKKIIGEEIQKFVDNLRRDFEQPIKYKLSKLLEEIEQKLNVSQSLLSQVERIPIQKMIYNNDLLEQVQNIGVRLNKCLAERKSMTFEGIIDDDVVLRFMGNFYNELTNLIQYPSQNDGEKANKKQPKKQKKKNNKILEININSNFPQAQLDDSFNINQIQLIQEKHLLSQSQDIGAVHLEQKKKNLLCSLQPNSKTLHLLQLTQLAQNPEIKSFKLDIQFDFNKYHRVLISENDTFFIISGYDPENFQEQNEHRHRQIYELFYDQETQKITVNNKFNSFYKKFRHSFGYCLHEKFIYIIGGFNYQTGALDSCEKISIENSNQIFPARSLKHPVSDNSCCVFNSKYIISIGGIEYNGKLINREQKLNQYLDIYLIEYDTWQQIQIFREEQENLQDLLIQPFYQAGIIQINENNIYIFGGKNKKEELLDQSFLLIINNENLDDEEQSHSLANNFNSDNDQFYLMIDIDDNVQKLNQPSSCVSQPAIFKNIIYNSFFNNSQEGNSQINIINQERGNIKLNFKQFKQNQWKDLSFN